MSRTNTPADSLDLLLGPMCNTFGVIVLVACITALLAQKPSDGAHATINSTKEMLERRLHAAETERDKLLVLLKGGTASLPSEQLDKLAEAERLKRALEGLQKKADELDKIIAQSAADAAVDPGLRIRQMRTEQRGIQGDIDSTKSTIDAMKEQIAQMEKKKRNLEKDRDKLTEERTVKWRLPREHSSELSPFPVIVRYGKIYPLHLTDHSRNPDIVRTDAGEDATRCEPEREKGWSLAADRAQIHDLLVALKSGGVYVSVYAYPDSFDVCRVFRQMVFDEGLQFGLLAVMPDRPLLFSKKGASPPPL